MSVFSLVNPDLILKALNLVGEELRSRKMLGEIMVCSGHVFLLRYGWNDDGNPIEQVDISFDGKNGPLRQACERAGRAIWLPDGWVERLLPRLCRDGTPQSGDFPTGMYPSWERPGLRVLAAPPHLLMPMVFLATMRPMPDTAVKDLEGAFRIAADAGIQTGRGLRNLVTPYIQRRPQEDSDLRKVVDARLSMFEHGLERFGLGPSLKFKPKSLADVAEITCGNPDWFHYALYRFLETFYLEHDRHTQQAMLDPAPVPLDMDWTDAWIGATGEHIAQRWSFRVPRWTQEGPFMGIGKPDFWSIEPVARDIEIVETPPAFRRRLLFTSAEPLMNAKFPNHMKVRMPYWR
jgi:hypothetical protein